MLFMTAKLLEYELNLTHITSRSRIISVLCVCVCVSDFFSDYLSVVCACVIHSQSPCT